MRLWATAALVWWLCAAGAHGGTIWVLGEGQPRGGGVPTPEAVKDALREVGDGAVIVSAGDIEARLSAESVGLVVVPGPGYPAAIRDRLLAYLQAGGGLLAFGGRPFSVPTFERGGQWRPLAEAPEDGAVKLPLDDWRVNQDTGAPTVALARSADGSSLELRVPEGSAWHYARRDVKGLLTADHSLISFRAKGDGTYEWICLELNEADGSRWKAWVPASREWRRYVVHTGDFLSYATKGRGGPGDCVRPEEVTALSLGGYRSLWGAGEHRLSVREVAFLKCPVPRGRLEVLSAPEALTQGLGITDNGGALPVWVDERVAGPAPLVWRTPDGQPAAVGIDRAGGWPLHVVTDARWFAGLPAGQACARAMPLIERRPDAGVLGAAVVSLAGPFRGSRWALVTVEDAHELLGHETGRAFLREVAAYVTARGPLIADVQLDMRTGEGPPSVLVTASVVNPSSETVQVEVNVELAGAEGNVRAEVAAGQTQPALVSIALPHAQPPLTYDARVELESGGRRVDGLTVSVQPRRTLEEAWDWVLSIQRPDGTFSSMYFVDAYAARALAGASRSGVKGAARYRAAALKWADGMVARQREDGGWWVGYGPPGQEVYVADDGSIALGIACLYAEGSAGQRAAYLEALRKYMAFREGFRNEDGGLGIGYTKTDYFAKPHGRFDEVTRETRGYPWTIGCSLGAAAALYAITGDPADRERAIRDTRYLIANAGSTGLAHGYYAEAVMLAHQWVDDEALRREIEAAIPGQFEATLYKPEYPFWRNSEGRNCLSLMALEWWRRTGGDEQAQRAGAAEFRALSRLCDPDSRESISYGVRQEGKLTILTGFALCGVQEMLGGLETYPRQMPRAAE